MYYKKCKKDDCPVKEEKSTSEVYGLIRKLGATSKYKGYYYVAEAVNMAKELQERPMKITKDIYPILARKYKSTPSNVEHNIRTLVNICWINHKEDLELIAGCSMEDKPTNSEFIDILAYYLNKTEEMSK